MTSRRFPILLTLCTSAAFVVLVSLGVWQVQRLQWKERLIAQVAAAQAAAPRPVDRVLAEPGADYRAVVIDCPPAAFARVAELYALHEGQAGARLIVACPVTSGGYRSILVDQGFVLDIVSARPGPPAAPVRVEGVLRRPEPAGLFAPAARRDGRTWYGRDIAGMARELGAPSPAPYFLFARTSTQPQWLALKPDPLPVALSNRHLGYAITWFGLAAALIGVYVAMLRRRP